MLLRNIFIRKIFAFAIRRNYLLKHYILKYASFIKMLCNHKVSFKVLGFSKIIKIIIIFEGKKWF